MCALSEHQSPDILVIKRSSRLRVAGQWHFSHFLGAICHSLCQTLGTQSVMITRQLEPYSAVIKLSAVAASAELDGRCR